MSLRGVFYSSPLGALLKHVFEDRSIKEEASVNYANDFLHMMYKPSVEGEMQVSLPQIVLLRPFFIRNDLIPSMICIFLRRNLENSIYYWKILHTVCA